jgi:hypothetical protein
MGRRKRKDDQNTFKEEKANLLKLLTVSLEILSVSLPWMSAMKRYKEDRKGRRTEVRERLRHFAVSDFMNCIT